MKRHIGVALIAMMLGFTGVAHAGDVAISSHQYDDGESAWVVINNQIWHCLIGKHKDETLIRNCSKMKMIED